MSHLEILHWFGIIHETGLSLGQCKSGFLHHGYQVKA